MPSKPKVLAEKIRKVGRGSFVPYLTALTRAARKVARFAELTAVEKYLLPSQPPDDIYQDQHSTNEVTDKQPTDGQNDFGPRTTGFRTLDQPF